MKWSSNHVPVRVAVAVAVVLLVGAISAGAEHLEAKMYGVDNWNQGCNGNSLNWSAMVDLVPATSGVARMADLTPTQQAGLIQSFSELSLDPED